MALAFTVGMSDYLEPGQLVIRDLDWHVGIIVSAQRRGNLAPHGIPPYILWHVGVLIDGRLDLTDYFGSIYTRLSREAEVHLARRRGVT